MLAPPPDDRTRLPEHAVAALLSVASAILMTWPLALHAADHVLSAIYYWDAYTNTMIMGSRVDAAIGQGPLSLYDSYYFAPLSNTIVFNENHFGLSLIFAPFYLLSGNPLWAYNVTLLISLSLSVFFTYLLVRRLTGGSARHPIAGSAYAGVLAGVAFTFCPYMTFEIGRIQLVATQWIPACFLMLHRAAEGRRTRDIVGLCICYLLQIGTCLYYAMFLIPLLSLAAAALLYRHRPPRDFYLRLAAAAAFSGAVALAMVYPYFTSRDAFALERSEAFASSFDGELSFFKNVHGTNRTLTAMHHRAEQDGAHEEIAFPGFTLLAMLLLAVGVPAVRALREGTSLGLQRTIALWLVTGLLAVGASALSHSMLAGVAVVGLGVRAQRLRGGGGPFAGPRGLYLGLLLLTVALFVGLTPGEYDGRPVHGLYYYFHTYFPGFNGIRKVSRQAVMTSFAFAMLSSFGAAWLFSRLPGRLSRAVVLAALLASTCYELRVFPHRLTHVWAGDQVPAAYRYLAEQPADAVVAVGPVDNGRKHFVGHRGMALHNYMALYHKHRMLNGKSTWIPPVTDLVHRALRFLPSPEARRILQTLGADYLLLHADDLSPQQRALGERLATMPGELQRVFVDGDRSVYRLTRPDDPTLALLDTPTLPAHARPIPASALRAVPSLRPADAARALDGDPSTYWTGRHYQAPGQYFEVQLQGPRPLLALEIENPEHLTHLPLSFDIAIATGDGPLRPVLRQPELRIYRELVYAPKDFIFRAVLPEATAADRIRITLRQPVPGRFFSIHELRLYEAATAD